MISTTGCQAVADWDHFGEQPILIEEDLPDLFLAQDDELPDLSDIKRQLQDLVVIEIVRDDLVFVLQIPVTLNRYFPLIM